MADAQQVTADAAVPESVTFREVQEIIRTFKDSDWSGMTLELGGMRIVVGKDGPPRSAATPASDAQPTSAAPARQSAPAAAQTPPPAPAPTAEATQSTPPSPSADTTGCVAVNSPAVGSFWVAPSPGQPPFVQVGQTVAEEEQLAIVEVMKLMNPVLAPTAGEVVQVCAANAELVEYEQVLFWIRPSDG
jgi:acetyl-CoA carboxylase biotin carboxyl carrier protein